MDILKLIYGYPKVGLYFRMLIINLRISLNLKKKTIPKKQEIIMYSHVGVMDSVFTKQSRGCRFDTWLVHMPVMLVTNAHPDIIKANCP